MAIKSTHTLDEAVRTIRRLAKRTGKPQSLVMAEAVAHRAAREEKSTPEERERLLNAFDELVARVRKRPGTETDREIANVIQSRRKGWVDQSAR